MNQFAKNVVVAFLSDDNASYLRKRINSHFLRANEVKEYVAQDFNRRHYAFSKRIERELSVSDPMEGTTRYDQVNMYNIQFLRETVTDIEKNILGDLTPIFNVAEKPQCNGRSSEGFNLQRVPANANDMLTSWKENPAPIHQFRDDNQGDYRASDRNTTDNKCYYPQYDASNGGTRYCADARSSPRYCGNAQTNFGEKKYNFIAEGFLAAQNGPTRFTQQGIPTVPRAIYTGNREQQASITYSNQDHVGGDYYNMQFDNQYIRALNTDAQPHTQQPFGYSTPESDARLLSRRIFRKNEDGVENGIPRYESRLYRRNLDRDNGETFADTQYDNVQRGHDMTDLFNQVNRKKYIADKSRDNLHISDQMLY